MKEIENKALVMAEIVNGVLHAARRLGIDAKFGLSRDGHPMFYSKTEMGFDNLIIDDDCDVSFMRLAKELKDVSCHVYFYPDIPSHEDLAKFLAPGFTPPDDWSFFIKNHQP